MLPAFIRSVSWNFCPLSDKWSENSSCRDLLCGLFVLHFIEYVITRGRRAYPETLDWCSVTLLAGHRK